MIPVQAKLIALAGTIVVVFMTGFKTSDHFAKVDAAKVAAKYNEEISAAKSRALTAEMLARSAESKASTAIAGATQLFEQVRENEKAATDRTITDLRNDVVRLRVSTKKTTRAPGLPGASTCAASGNDQAEQTLTGSVAARLAERYADYNALIGQLELCQATVIVDRQMTNAR